MSADLNPILNKLIGKSEEGKVHWKPTYDADTFIAALEGEFTFQIAKVGPQYTFVMKDKEDHNLVEITSQKRGWNEAPELGHVYFEQLDQLYDLARDIALNISQKLTAAESLLDRF
jgi:hypothetical protein